MRYMTFCVIVIACFSFYFTRKQHNNVCKTFGDYYWDRDNNPNCYYNPDADLTVPEIIRRRGYPVQEYRITTEDGYILTLFRIPHGKRSIGNKSKQPAFIQHGFGTNSASFVNIGKKSLAFILADAGYDVWLGNFRGTMYSRNHTHFSSSDSKFWNFSMNELGLYDIPAKLNLIYDVTKQKIVYIGFSLGAVTAYMYGTMFPDNASEKIKIIISLGPAVFIKEGTLLPKRYLYWLWPYVEPFLEAVTSGELNLKGAPNNFIRRMLCLPLPLQINVCQILEMLCWGFDYEQNDPETLPITTIQNSDSYSIKQLGQIIQYSTKGEFEFFDFGAEDNKKRYGSLDPPKYNISKLQVPTYLICAENDLLVTKKDVQKLHESLPKETKPYDVYVIKYDKFNHGDYLSARDVVPLLYDHIVMFIQKL